MPKGYILIYVLALGLAVSLLAGVWYIKNNFSESLGVSPSINNQNLTELSKKIVDQKAEEAKWKRYQNSQYNFELKFPGRGIVLGEKDDLEGECGGAISEKSKGNILVDNFFEIKVAEGQETVENYLASIAAKDQYNLESFTAEGADEAVEVLGLKKGAEYAVGYPPLIYVTHIFRQGERIFLIKDFLHPENIGGCINPKVLDPVKYPKIANKDWNLKKSFKFITVSPGGADQLIPAY